MSEPQFPIHPNDRELLASVSWPMLLQHERQAETNHGQSLATLAARGGLGILELYYVLRDSKYRLSDKVPLDHALAFIKVREELHRVYRLVDHWAGEAKASESALRKLVLRLDEIHADPQYQSVWQLYMIHGGDYTEGPKYDKELEEARAALRPAVTRTNSVAQADVEPLDSAGGIRK